MVFSNSQSSSYFLTGPPPILQVVVLFSFVTAIRENLSDILFNISYSGSDFQCLCIVHTYQKHRCVLKNERNDCVWRVALPTFHHLLKYFSDKTQFLSQLKHHVHMREAATYLIGHEATDLGSGNHSVLLFFEDTESSLLGAASLAEDTNLDDTAFYSI